MAKTLVIQWKPTVFSAQANRAREKYFKYVGWTFASQYILKANPAVL